MVILGAIIYAAIVNPTGFSTASLFGMGLGSLICCYVFLKRTSKLIEGGWYMAHSLLSGIQVDTFGYLDTIFSGIDAGLALEEIYSNFEEPEDGEKLGLALFSIGTGIFSLIIASFSLNFLESTPGNRFEKARMANIFGVMSLFVSTVFISLSILRATILQDE